MSLSPVKNRISSVIIVLIPRVVHPVRFVVLRLQRRTAAISGIRTDSIPCGFSSTSALTVIRSLNHLMASKMAIDIRRSLSASVWRFTSFLMRRSGQSKTSSPSPSKNATPDSGSTNGSAMQSAIQIVTENQPNTGRS